MSRLLLIDDEESFRGTMAKALIRSGFEVVEAADGGEGLRLALQSPPELILCDVVMAGMNGYEVMAALRREPALANIPLILLTGQSEPAQMRQGMNLGADDYLTKPVSLPDLLGAIAARLQRRQEERQGRETPPPSEAGDVFLVETSTEKRLVKIDEIKSIHAEGEYSRVFWGKNPEGALIRKSLKRWLLELPARQFIRVHRRAIVNLNFMERVERLSGGRMQVRVRDSAKPIPVSLRLAPALNRKLAAAARR